MRLIFVLCVFYVAALFTPVSAIATENGLPTTAFGVYDFGAGFLPEATPVGTVGLRVSHYTTTTLKDAQGNTKNSDISADATSFGFFYLRMTETEILGAKYGFAAIVPLMRMSGHLNVFYGDKTVFSERTDIFRVADMQVIPVLLKWNPSKNLAVNAQMQIQAPTGDYDKNRVLNIGLNHWAFSPIFNFSYISDGGLEVSSSFQMDFSTRNKDTGYRNGVEYRHEFAVGQHFGPWTAGVGGYYYTQLSNDSSPSLTDGNRAKVMALGPALSFYAPGLPPVFIHAYKEFGARNRTEGYQISMRVSYSF